MGGDNMLISPEELRSSLASERFPFIVDVRLPEDRAALPRAVPASRLVSMAEALSGSFSFSPDRPITVVCHRGLKLSQAVAAELRRRGLPARALEGGIVRWTEEGRPSVDLSAIERFGAEARRPFVTRVRPKIDRVACPWLITRFIDPEARFWFVEADQVAAVAERTGAIPYDVPEVEITHVGDLCSFDALVSLFGLQGDPALTRLATIIRGADTGAFHLAPEAAGLLAVSLGLSVLAGPDDFSMLARAMPVYDALYAWALHASGETHSWKGKP